MSSAATALPTDLAAFWEVTSEQVLELMRFAYERGVQDGSEAMRNAILTAAQAPVAAIPLAANLSGKSHLSADLTISRTPSARAPRGSVRAAISAILREHPEGLAEFDLGQAASQRDPDVSPRSMGGELRRMRDKLYRFAGGRWFLIAPLSETETAEATTSAVPSTSAIKEEIRAPDTAIIT